jgi:hypothetical protein
MCKMLVTLGGCSVVSQEGENVTLAIHGLKPLSDIGINDRDEAVVGLLRSVDLPMGFADDVRQHLDRLMFAWVLTQRVLLEE